MTQKIVIVDYGSGNLRSVAKALERAANDKAIAANIIISNNADDVQSADRVVLPGQGAFADCSRCLSMIPDMLDCLIDFMSIRQKPLLGICVGMQLMADWSHEHGNHRGLSVIPGNVVPIAADRGLKIPHMGWNDLVMGETIHPIQRGLKNGDHVYFVHSYHYQLKDPVHLLASVDYGGPIAAIIGHENIIATQFHPEKSQATGLTILGNFLEWQPLKTQFHPPPPR